MRRILSLLVALVVFTGIFSTALAEVFTADEMMAHGQELCVYIGEGNLLYAAGGSEPLVREKVRAIVHASDTALVYEVADESHVDTDREGILTALDLAAETPQPAPISTVSVSSVWSKEDGLVYYASHDNPNALMQYDPAYARSEPACDAGAPITRIRMSADGLLVSTDSGERLYVPVLRRLADPVYPAPNSIVETGDRFETVLDANAMLSIRLRGSAVATAIAENVTCSRIDQSIIHYLQVEGGKTHLKSYEVSSGTTADMFTFSEAMLNELAVGDGFVFAVGESFVVYRYAILTGECVPFSVLPKSDVYHPVIKAFEEMLLVYDAADEVDQNFVMALEVGAPPSQEDGKGQPDLDNFKPTPSPAKEEVAEEPEDDGTGVSDETVDAEDPSEKAAREKREAAAAKAAKKAQEDAAKKKETQEYTLLANGSTGEAVARLQQRLKELGYFAGKVDGIYGKSTQRAVTYLQGDMGYAETGSAGPKFQNAVFGGKAPHYVTYVALGKGDEGIRVRDLQARLRSLYYMSVNAGGHYQANTVAAVKRFQKQMGYKQTGGMTVNQLKKLFSKSAPTCKIFFTLKKGDSAPVVKALNQRLKKLGYFHGTATNSYSQQTYDAVWRFQAAYGIMATGECEPNLQSMIYDKNAKHYDDPNPWILEPVQDEQVITDAQLKVVRDWMNKHFKKEWTSRQAVGKMQDGLIKLKYMTKAKKTMVYDAATKAAILKFQNAAMPGEKHTGIGGPNTLSLLFHLQPEQGEQVITDAQLKLVRDWMNKHFKKEWTSRQAVGKMQDGLIKLKYMTKSQKTSVYDATTKAAMLKFQNAAMPGEKHTGIAGPNTLSLLFR